MKNLLRYTLWGILVLCILGALFVGTANLCVFSRAGGHIRSLEEAPQGTDCVLVLGAGVRDGVLSPALRERMDTGIALYRSGAGKKLLLSGDHGRRGYDEVNAMKTYALEQGVPLEDIFLDHAGFSTYESLYRAKAVFQVDTAVVVTQAFHLPRAVYIARALGLQVCGVATQSTYQVRAADHLRELLARANAFLAADIFRPLPTYLGNAIPISGSGILSHD